MGAAVALAIDLLTSFIYECRIVATELMIESTHGFQIVVLM